MHPVEAYFAGLAKIRNTGGGVKEESYYGPLQTLLDEVGKSLKPKVFAVGQLANLGWGKPDIGLFSKTQEQRNKGADLATLKPERGVIEVKGWDDDIGAVAKSEQVKKYLEGYGLVLVTNYRQFVLVGRDDNGDAHELERFELGNADRAFPYYLDRPRAGAEAYGEPLVDFLRRVMTHTVPLTNPEDLAWYLASYARTARFMLEEKRELPALAHLRKALEEALGLTFEDEKGEHFFRATLVQTLFYGVFSSWVLWAREHPGKDGFEWRNAAWTLHVPMIASLFEQIATPQKLKPLGIDQILDWAGAALNRVEQGAFFQKFEEEHAVQYFYEPFLKHYDAELRKDLGVWYTPPEIVAYQVERVDRVLRDELGIADGLADDKVVVLDPCCGTGAYLVETLRRIHKTLEEKGGSALVAQKLKKAAKDRVFGFEILPAPFVVAHLQLGLVLRRYGAPLANDANERAGVYLTNALTGWEPLEDPKDLLFPELQKERDAANKVKQESPIIVILGNPPYNGFAGLAVEEERDLVAAYRTTKHAPNPQGQGLNDLYIRFFRMAERRIVDKSGKGVICYISNYSWLEGLSHTGMRERYLEVFDKVWIDNLHGDRIISEYAPDGKTSETVFALGGHAPGIKIGTAIALLVKKAERTEEQASLFYKDFNDARAQARREALLESASDAHGSAAYLQIQPNVEIGLPFKPAKVDAGYLEWPQLPDLFPISFPGVKTSRDEFLVDIDRDDLEERIAAYFDPSNSDEAIARRWPSVMEERGRYKAREIRKYLVERGRTKGAIVRYAYRPFDVRWLYWEPETKLLDEKRSEYFPQVFEGNEFFSATQRNRRPIFYSPLAGSTLADHHIFESNCALFPRLLIEETESDGLFYNPTPTENATKELRKYREMTDSPTGETFYHAFAIMHAPKYEHDNHGGLRQDWPRIPLPATREALEASAALGRRVADLLDTEKGVRGVTEGTVEPALRPVAVIEKAGGGQLTEADLALTAGWGHGGKGGVTMPGRGKLAERKPKAAEAHPVWGDATADVYLNDGAYWRHVPKPVWDYTIGGYQVMKKWLSYREQSVLGRALTMEEAEYVTEMARRIAALILLQPELDANYRRVKADVYPWPKGG